MASTEPKRPFLGMPTRLLFLNIEELLRLITCCCCGSSATDVILELVLRLNVSGLSANSVGTPEIRLLRSGCQPAAEKAACLALLLEHLRNMAAGCRPAKELLQNTHVDSIQTACMMAVQHMCVRANHGA